ncbi:FmdE family protein [Methanorbis rubei]
MKDYSDAVAFHGHSCGGLAVGYKACELAAKELGLDFSEDEEIVAIAETDSCTVDAVQVILGCTAGKGNLFVNNWGKTAFSFYRRDNNTSIRLVAIPDAIPKNAGMVALRPKIMGGLATPAEQEEFHRFAHEHVDQILATPAEQLFEIKQVQQPCPEEANIYNNVVCSVCGEQVADGLAKLVDGKYICVPCQKNNFFR